MKTTIPIVLALAGNLIWIAGCAPGSTDDAGSADRRDIVVYSPHGEDILREFRTSFEAAHPEYRVVALDMGSKVVLDRLRGERENPHCDIWWGAPVSLFMLGAGEGLLAPYEPSWADTAAGHRDPDQLWHGVFKLPIVVGYNREVTKPAELPASWDDVVDPKYRGQIVMRHPPASGTLTTLCTARIYASVRDTDQPDAGYKWLLGLDASTASYQPNPQAMYDAIARDERGRWTLWGLSDLVYQSTRSSDPLPFGFKVLQGETPVILDCIALVNGGREAEGARLFYEHVTTPESLANLAHRHQKIPVRTDLDRESLPEWMRDLELQEMKIDWKVLADHTAEWMNHWDLEIEGRGAEALKDR